MKTPVAASADGLTQGSIAAYATSQSGTHYGQHNPRQHNLTKSLVLNVIVKCNLPVSLVDNADFRAFLADLDPKFTPPCRQTVTYTILPQLLESQKAKVHAIVDSSSDISLTADIWTDKRCHAFLAVTFHVFINGQPVSGLLAFRAFRGSRTGVLISEAMESMISDYGIGSKIRTIVTDNAENMRKAMSVLLTSDEIPNNDLDDVDDDVDDPLLWEDDPSVDLGPILRSAFEKVMGSGRSIPAINDTRWNSVFKQLSAVCSFDQTKQQCIA